jgi:hypothetical protein
MNSTTVNTQSIINDLFTLLEAHVKETGDCYIGNPYTVRDALATAINSIQLGDAVNRCVECKMDMGQSNPRQYCAKTHCANAPFDD